MRIGLALSGGAVRGIAHLGALSVLDKAGVPIDCLAGCSAGAILGAAYCSGMSIEDMESLVPYMSWRRLASRARGGGGLLHFDKLERWLVMLIGELDFDDLDIPFAVVAMDAVTGERVMLDKGPVAPAVRASCSIPGIIAPVEIDNRLLVDGGIIDNLPVDVARELGADYVIGVDVFEPKFDRAWGPIGPGVMAIETLVRHAGGGVGRADFLISPKTSGRTYARFSKHQELIALGQEAAERSLPQLLEDLEQKSKVGN